MRVVKAEFQRLLGFKDVSIEIDPHLQLIAGPNNAGKSTLVRLLELYFSNPSGNVLQEKGTIIAIARTNLCNTLAFMDFLGSPWSRVPA